MNKIISNEKNNKKLLTKQMNSTIIIKRLERGAKKYRGVEQSVARRAHNPKVVGSSPASATTKEQVNRSALFFFKGYDTTSYARWGEAVRRRRWRIQA